MSASKARQVLDLIRGKSVGAADDVLALSERDAARVIQKCLRSAVANAEHNDGLDPEELFVSTCFADEGPTLRRFRPRARGRATRIRKRTCHITVIVSRYDADELAARRERERAKGARRWPPATPASRRRRVAKSRGEEVAEETPTDEVEETPDRRGAETEAEGTDGRGRRGRRGGHRRGRRRRGRGRDRARPTSRGGERRGRVRRGAGRGPHQGRAARAGRRGRGRRGQERHEGRDRRGHRGRHRLGRASWPSTTRRTSCSSWPRRPASRWPRAGRSPRSPRRSWLHERTTDGTEGQPVRVPPRGHHRLEVAAGSPTARSTPTSSSRTGRSATT